MDPKCHTLCLNSLAHVKMSPKSIKVRNRCFPSPVKRCQKTNHEGGHDFWINFDVKNRFLTIFMTFNGKSIKSIFGSPKTKNHITVPGFDNHPLKMMSQNRQKSCFLPASIFDHFYDFLGFWCFRMSNIDVSLGGICVFYSKPWKWHKIDKIRHPQKTTINFEGPLVCEGCQLMVYWKHAKSQKSWFLTLSWKNH